MLPEILTEIVRDAGGDHLLLDARNGRGIISDATQVELVCRKLSNAGFTRLVNFTGMHVSVGSGRTPNRPEEENGNEDGLVQGPAPTRDEYSLFLTIRNPEHGHSALTLKWKWQAGDTAHPSLSQIWQAAGLAEREMFEMLGIPFSNNTQLTPLFLDETFAGHPLRLDFVDEPEPSYAEQLLKSRHEKAMIEALIGSREASSRVGDDGEQGSPLPGSGRTPNRPVCEAGKEDGLVQGPAPTQDNPGGAQ